MRKVGKSVNVKKNEYCRVPIWGALFTVDVSKPKPNRPNTINLVEKRAWELGLCENAFNGRAGSLGNWIVYSVVGGKVKARPWSSAEDDFFFSSSDTPPIELPGVFRIAVPPLHRISLVIYPFVLFILAVHLSIAQVATWVSISSSASLNLLWVVVVSMALFRSHSLINAARLPAAGIQCGGDRLSYNGLFSLLP